MKRVFPIHFLFLSGVCATLLPFPAYVQELPEWFNHDSAKDVFDNDIQVVPGKEFIHLRPKQEPVKETAPQAHGVGQRALPDTAIPQDYSRLSPQEKILKQYGDPTERVVVKAVDTAPAPYKAMLAALAAGDKELAFRYAAQYVRYRRDLDNTVSRAMSLQGQAMVREGVLPADSWASSPRFQEDFYLRDLDLGTERDEEIKSEKDSEDSFESRLNAKAQELIKRAEDAQHALFQAEPALDSASLELDETTERNNARQKFAGRLPIDPKGEVDIFYFFRPNDRMSIGIAPDIEKLYKTIHGDSHHNFFAMTLDRMNTSAVNYFRSATGVTFPIVSGAELAAQMKLNTSPTTVFITRTSQQVHYEPGVQNFFYLDEIRTMMRGKV